MRSKVKFYSVYIDIVLYGYQTRINFKSYIPIATHANFYVDWADLVLKYTLQLVPIMKHYLHA